MLNNASDYRIKLQESVSKEDGANSNDPEGKMDFCVKWNAETSFKTDVLCETDFALLFHCYSLTL